MRKLRIIEPEGDSLITCDHPGCGYEIVHSDAWEQDISPYIDQSCPKCGHNLLTMQDYSTYIKMKKSIDFVNRWFGWLSLFVSKKSKADAPVINVHVYEGIHIITDDKTDNLR